MIVYFQPFFSILSLSPRMTHPFSQQVNLPLLCIVGIFVPNHSQKDHKAIQLSNFRLKDQFRLMAKGENLSIILWKSRYFGLKQHKNIKNAILNVLKCQKNLLFSFLLLYPKRGKCTQ